MNLPTFLDYAMHAHVEIHKTIRGWDWYEYQKLAGLTKYLNYGCSFENGKCGSNFPNGQKDMYCCSGCFSMFGHFQELPNDYTQLCDYARHFSEKKEDSKGKIIAAGFWRKGKGCILDRSKRSTICLRFCCNGEHITEAGKMLLLMLADKKGNMRVNKRNYKYQWQAVETMEKWLTT